MWNKFCNPIGLAAGFDKNGNATNMERFWFGFARLGTVTKFAQNGNPKPRLADYQRKKQR